MAMKQYLRRFFVITDVSVGLLSKQDYQKILFNVVYRFQSHWSKPKNDNVAEPQNGGFNDSNQRSDGANPGYGTDVTKYASDDFFNNYKWKLELAWLAKALEPAFQLWRSALPTGTGDRPPPTSRSLWEIFASFQRSKIGLQDWSLSDLTIGLYLIYLRQASAGLAEDLKGEQISSESIVHDLIYHMELAKGAYKANPSILARISMLRESNVVKFVRNSSVLRPGYYICVDTRRKNVILGIRGTHTLYDLITDIISSSHEELTYEGYSTHFGMAEGARWFLRHEMETVKNCLEKHEGFRLRIVGHSLGGAIASLLAIMLRKKSIDELGFDPLHVSAIGFASPPCVSRELAESCSDFVTTVVMQDDIIPRLSTSSLTRLRNQIVQTDWVTVFEKEDWKRIVDIVTNAKLVVSSVQDVVRKLADYAKLGGPATFSEIPVRNEALVGSTTSHVAARTADAHPMEKGSCSMPEELFVPGALYYLKRNLASQSSGKGLEYFTLWKRYPGEHFQQILLSSNLISDHRCDSHIYALRDVLKGLPVSLQDSLF